MTDRALCDYAVKLTRIPGGRGTQADIDKLREAGLSDQAISDAAQVISYFNYINRIAEGLGVGPRVRGCEQGKTGFHEPFDR